MSENKGTNKAAAATPTTAEPLFEVVAVYAVDRVGLVPVGAYEDANPSAAAAQYFEVAAVADIIAPSMNPSVASAAPGSDVSAPARNGTGPEPGAMDARDCIRRQFLGKRVKVRYVAGRVAHVLRATDDETVAMALVKRGLAVPRDGIREHAWRTALENASSEARRQGRGKWSLAPISERSRHITPFPAAAKSLQEQSLVATLVGATMNVTVEDVISVNRLQAVTVSSLQEFTFRIAGVGYPTFTDPAVSAAIADKLSDALFDGKALLRRRLLHREIRISVDAYDATARVFHGSLLATGVSGSSSTLPHQNSELLGSPTQGPAAPPSATGNIAPLVLKLLSSGWAVVERVNLSLTPSPNELLEAEFNARTSGKGLWAYVPPSAVEVGRVLDTDPFDGTVTEVHSPNVVTIVSEASGQSTDVMLAFVHADPVEREPETPIGIVVKYTTRWLTARQHLRTIALGRVVRCVPIAAPPHRLMIANISLLDEAAIARANLTVELAAAGVCELRPVSLRPTFDLQLEPPSEILALVPTAAPHAAASAGLVHIEDDDDGDIPVVAAKQPIRATPGRMTKTTPARPGSSPDLSSRAPPAAPLFDDPFAGASADLFAGARAAFHSTAVTVAAGSKTEAESVPPPLPPGQGSDGALVGGSTTPVSILHAARHRSALSRVNLPLGPPLVADVEAVDNFATLLCLVPACGVAVPVVLAGIALSSDDMADTVHGMRLNLLHQRVTIEVTGLALSDAAFAAVVRTPSIPNVAAQLLVMGLGVVTRLCEVYAQHGTEVESLLAAEEAARHHRAGLWHESRQEYRTHLLSLLPAAGVVPCVSGRPIEAVHADCVSFVERTLTSGNLHVVTLSFDAASQLFLAQFVNELDVNAAFAALQQAAEAAPFIPFSDDAAVPDADVVGQSVLASRTNTQTAIVCWCRATIVAISESGENKGRLFTLRYVDFGDSATLPAGQIRVIDNAARGDRHRRPFKSNGKRREAAARQAAAHVDDDAAAAIVTLATTPSLVSEFRLAYVIINVMTPAVRRILSLAEHPDGLFPVVEYVWQNQPYVSLYRNKDAVAAGEASLSSLLLQETQPGEVDVDLRLMDVPQLVTAVAALLSTPRAQLVQPADVVEARPTATSKRGAGRVNGKGRGTTNHSSVAAETTPPTVAKPAVPSSTRRRAPVTA